VGKVGTVDYGVVSVTSLWADEEVSSPVDVESCTLAHHAEKGEDDPACADHTHDRTGSGRAGAHARTGLPFRRWEPMRSPERTVP
jgi:hypothetical protein